MINSLVKTYRVKKMIYFYAIVCSLLVSMFVKQQNNSATIQFKKFRLRISNDRIRRNTLIFLSALGPLLVSALRYGIGTDYFHTYIPEFKIIVATGKNYSYEFGFFLLNKVISLFTQNGQWLIAITSIIYIYIVYKEIFCQAEKYTLSIILFYLSYNYFVSLNNIRQSLASAMLLLAIYSLIHGEKKWFMIWVFIAGTIHQSSFMLIIMLIIDKLCLSAVTYLIMSAAVIVVGKIVLPKILSSLAPFLLHLGDYLTRSDLQIYREKTIGSTFILVNFLIILIFVYIDLLYKPDDKSMSTEDKLEWNYAKLNQCIVLCVCAFDGILPAAYRFARVFTFAQFILVPNVICKLEKNKRDKILSQLIVIILFSIMFLKNYLSGTEGVFPYVSIFHKY